MKDDMSFSVSGKPEAVAILPVFGIPEIPAGADLASMLSHHLRASLRAGDIIVITSKIISKAEGRSALLHERDEAITNETVRVVATRQAPSGHETRIVENRLGIVAAAAGVDASNTPDGTILLLPEDPDRSARLIAEGLRRELGIQVGVIISDTLGRPWRYGQTDCAIGAAGVHVIEDLTGVSDTEGRPLTVTAPCVADELAGAAELVKRKTNRVPVAIVRGRGDLVGDLALDGARSIVRAPEDDMFRLGTEEAWTAGYAAALSASASRPTDQLGMEERVRR